VLAGMAVQTCLRLDDIELTGCLTGVEDSDRSTS
jgi:hypothetical protein